MMCGQPQFSEKKESEKCITICDIATITYQIISQICLAVEGGRGLVTSPFKFAAESSSEAGGYKKKQ